MVDFVVTPPYVIPIAIALAVLAVATFKEPAKAPDFYRVTIDLPKATYDALAPVSYTHLTLPTTERV